MSKTPTIPANAVRPARGPGGRNAAAAAPGGPETPKLQPNRAERAADRRQAIIEAALDEFIARGFTATRLDDVAKRAGVAKGTIYLHFKDKESMFEELIRTALVPLIDRLHAPPSPAADRSAMRSRGLPGPSSRRSRRPGAATSCG